MTRVATRSDKESKEIEDRYRAIFENSKDMVFITTVGGRFIEVNEAGVEMLGYSDKNELMKMNVSDTYFHPEMRKILQEKISKEGFIKDFEIELRRKDGTTIDCIITATLRKDEDGHAIGYEGIIKNISDRKKMEEELIQRAKELQTLYDLSILVNQSLDLESVLPIALEKTCDLTGLESGGIYLYDENEGILELKSHKGCSPAFLQRISVLKYGEGVGGKAVELKKAIFFSVDEYPFPELLSFHKREGTQSLLGIPLLAKGKVTGAITLSSRFIRTVDQREIHLLESIGNQMGFALENAKLFSNVAKAKSEWETTFDAVTDLITIRDKDYRIVRANRAMFQRLGLNPEELIGRRCFEAIHHRDAPCERCHLSKTLRTKRPAFGERESDYLKGFTQYYTFPIYDEKGEFIAVVDLEREITEQRRMEMEKGVVNNINKILASSLDVRQVMQAVHSELEKVLNSERMTIALWLEKGEWYRFFSLKEDLEAKEMVGRITYPIEGTPHTQVLETGLPVIIKDTANIDSWFCQRLLKEGIRSSIVFPLEYKGRIIGTMNISSKRANNFSENQFNFLRQISTALAISIENSLLLDEMKKSEEKYRTVVENALDGVLVVGEDFRFRYVNEKLAEILGYSTTELIGMDFRNYLDESSKQLVSDRYVRRQKGEDVPPRYEFNILRKEGEIRGVEISSTIVKDSEGHVNSIAFVKDITEKKKMEEQMIQNEKLRALGEMASGVAHDFNNALAAILGNTQLLLYNAKDEEFRESLKTIEKVTRDGAQTVRRLQDFTRKRVHQEISELDINSIVTDAIEISKPRWKDEVQAGGISTEMVTRFDDIPSVLGNDSEMKEIIASMIFNALEAMPAGGKIEIRTFERKGKVHIQISDTGIGMTEEVRKKVFEPFFTTKPFSNTGLGLSMSYGIIKRLGGEIEVESKIGKGTTFTIILPCGSKRPSLMAKGREVRVLVIDDEETVRGVLTRILSQINCRVTTAENGQEGVRLFKERDFDIVLTDLGMPGMSGWEVCKAIKKMNPHTPVGMITGWEAEVDRTKVEEHGIDFLIPKPFQFAQIFRVLGKTIPSKAS